MRDSNNTIRIYSNNLKMILYKEIFKKFLVQTLSILIVMFISGKIVFDSHENSIYKYTIMFPITVCLYFMILNIIDTVAYDTTGLIENKFKLIKSIFKSRESFMKFSPIPINIIFVMYFIDFINSSEGNIIIRIYNFIFISLFILINIRIVRFYFLNVVNKSKYLRYFFEILYIIEIVITAICIIMVCYSTLGFLLEYFNKELMYFKHVENIFFIHNYLALIFLAYLKNIANFIIINIMPLYSNSLGISYAVQEINFRIIAYIIAIIISMPEGFIKDIVKIDSINYKDKNIISIYNKIESNVISSLSKDVILTFIATDCAIQVVIDERKKKS